MGNEAKLKRTLII